MHKKLLKKIDKQLNYDKTHNPEEYKRKEDALKKIAER